MASVPIKENVPFSESPWQEMHLRSKMGWMERANENSKDMEFALAIMGEKPKEQIELSQEAPFEVNISVVE